jgi:hypothetical protein
LALSSEVVADADPCSLELLRTLEPDAGAVFVLIVPVVITLVRFPRAKDTTAVISL